MKSSTSTEGGKVWEIGLPGGLPPPRPPGLPGGGSAPPDPPDLAPPAPIGDPKMGGRRPKAVWGVWGAGAPPGRPIPPNFITSAVVELIDRGP